MKRSDLENHQRMVLQLIEGAGSEVGYLDDGGFNPDLQQVLQHLAQAAELYRAWVERQEARRMA